MVGAQRARGVIRSRVQPDGIALAVGMLVVGAYLVALASSTQEAEYGAWGGLALVPVLLLVVAGAARWIASIEKDAAMTRLVLAALACKVVGTVARYIVTFDVYEKADAAGYDRAGAELARSFRAGVFDIGSARLDGSRVLEIVTGVVYTIIGPTIVGGFVVFSLLGFVGLYLCYRAFRIGVPEGDARRYALLLLFLPSLLYWPSSVGKEAWMCLALGLTSYGAARLLTRDGGGLLPLLVGFAGAAAVRPHVALLLVGGLGVSYLLRRSASLTGPFTKVLGIALFVGVGLLAVSRAQSAIGLEGLSGSAIENVLSTTEHQTSGGGSAFASVRVRTPLDVPMAIVTVLFRPFPHEAGNAQTLLAALEGLLLIGLFVAGRRRLLNAFSLARRRPYVTFAVAYSFGFIVAFSSIANFGILTRQRVQLLPFVLLLLAIPERPRHDEAPAPRWVPAHGSGPAVVSWAPAARSERSTLSRPP